MKTRAALIGGLALGLLLMYCGTNGVPDWVSRKPTKATVGAAFADYRVRMSAAWTEGASESFESDREAFDWIKSRADVERKAAFAPVHEREQATIGGEKYSDAARKTLWLQFAKEAK